LSIAVVTLKCYLGKMVEAIGGVLVATVGWSSFAFLLRAPAQSNLPVKIIEFIVSMLLMGFGSSKKQ